VRRLVSGALASAFKMMVAIESPGLPGKIKSPKLIRPLRHVMIDGNSGFAARSRRPSHHALKI
jgi:hypothetical protein